MSAPSPHRYRWLLHIDLDQFQVAVERLRSPDLVGEPVIVGGNGDPTEARKVVTCASYEARAQGVRAGMPLRSAYRKLPDAVYLPLDMPAYDAASAQVMDTLRGFGHPVEVWGWDEAYIGVGDLDEPDPTAGSAHEQHEQIGDAQILQIATDIRAAVADRCGLASRVGISDNKQRAKMATGFAKRDVTGVASGLSLDLPPKVFLLDARNWIPLMGGSPPIDLWSVGPRTADKLTDMGITTVDALVATPREVLIERFGPHQGNWLYVLCRGGGDSTITVEQWEAKSHSKSRTFPADLTDPDQIASAATELTDELLDQVRAEGRVAFRVAVTVRTSTFYTRTKSKKLPAPTTDRDAIVPNVAGLLTRFDEGRPIRLLGVRLDLVPGDDENRADEQNREVTS